MTIRRAPLRKGRIAGLLVVVAVAAVAFDQLPASSSSSTGRPAGGPAPDGGAILDEEAPAVANLDPALRGALRRAATDAADDGVALRVDSGWRSPQHQQRLLDEAVVTYGSAEEAARWVATPDRSAHVAGNAVDIAPSGATAWLSQHGAEYGLCQIYRNEPWHYELRFRARAQGCPSMYADPTQDPRLR